MAETGLIHCAQLARQVPEAALPRNRRMGGRRGSSLTADSGAVGPAAPPQQ
jgi:hypothetical protein